jgi:hypothetical protein
MECQDVGEANPDIAGIGVSPQAGRLTQLGLVDSPIIIERQNPNFFFTRFSSRLESRLLLQSLFHFGSRSSTKSGRMMKRHEKGEKWVRVPCSQVTTYSL